ncbi:MAG: homocysteine S-methyltransferase family protein [Pseudomonadota bacterium]
MAVTLLDGGMGQELVRRAGRATPLWATQVLLDAPDLVRAVHDDFFNAGADVATANTYAVLPDRLEAYDLTDKLTELTETACQIAVAARDAFGHGLVAGSLGPLGFSYQPDKAPAPDQAAEVYAKLAVIQAQFVDVLLLETMSSVAQARGGLMGARIAGKPVWVAFSVDDEDGTRLRSGEPLSEIDILVSEFSPDGIFINCSRPEAIGQGLPELGRFGVPFGAYGNGFIEIDKRFNSIGSTTDQLTARSDIGPERYADFVDDWVAKGATMVGGCCEIGPAHISEIYRRHRQTKAKTVAYK